MCAIGESQEGQVPVDLLADRLALRDRRRVAPFDGRAQRMVERNQHHPMDGQACFLGHRRRISQSPVIAGSSKGADEVCLPRKLCIYQVETHPTSLCTVTVITQAPLNPIFSTHC